MYCSDNITENLGKFETFQHKQVEECSQLSEQLEVNIRLGFLVGSVSMNHTDYNNNDEKINIKN